MHPMPAKTLSLVLAAALGTAAGAAGAVSDSELRTITEKRLHGDRTGACLAVAVVEGDDVSRAFTCADPADVGRIGPDSAFEIGSVAKTMTAALLADLVVRGEASLDDPLSAWLPSGANVPEFDGQPILLRHIVTHSSGLPALPPGVVVTDMTDPYAKMTPQELLAALGRVELTRAPGSRFEYSNFASMLLSQALAHRAGRPFPELLDARLFAPLGMEGAHVAGAPSGVVAATGHLPTAVPTSAWHFHPDLAGVGGVRATLDDMVAYVQAHLGQRPSELDAALALSRQPVEQQADRATAMNWMLVPLDGRSVHVHEGGTGGFSSLVAFDQTRNRGVVVLSDTALTALGGLGDIGMHLLDASVPLGEPRRVATPPPALVEALVGDYRFDTGMRMQVRRHGDSIEVQVPGQPAFALGYDDAGDFYPLQLDALMRPLDGGRDGFTWHQGGGVMAARRVDAAAEEAARAAVPALPAETLAGYHGEYPLMPGFALTVRSSDGQLLARATGQDEFALDPVGEDVFTAEAFGIEITFGRDAQGRVDRLALAQGGQVLHGERAR